MWDTLIERDFYELDSARVIEMRLDDDADAVATVLLISDDGSYAPTDSAFLDPEWYAVGKENIFVQHWRTVPAPVLDSAVQTGPLAVTLHWRNEGVDRDIDSTVVFRDDVPIAMVGPGVISYPDTVPSTDTYTYGLKHVTRSRSAARTTSGSRGSTAGPPPSPAGRPRTPTSGGASRSVGAKSGSWWARVADTPARSPTRIWASTSGWT
jgi:hypothetical protein